MDPVVRKLADFFATHPVWVEAARSVKDGASSKVLFSHVDGEWHLLRQGGQSLLLEGAAADPDLGFCFPPGAVERVTSVDGDMGDVAVELFQCINSDDPDIHVEFRVLTSFARLLRRGYVQVLLRGGPKVLQFGASRGIRTLSDLRQLLKKAQSGEPMKVERSE